MTTAAINKALKQLATALKTPTKRAKNPAPRIGTAKPRRKSQVTGKTPTKRLVARRKVNAKKGYFPNPSEVAKAHKTPNFPYCVQKQIKNVWEPVGEFHTEKDARAFAEMYAKGTTYPVRLIKY